MFAHTNHCFAGDSTQDRGADLGSVPRKGPAETWQNNDTTNDRILHQKHWAPSFSHGAFGVEPWPSHIRHCGFPASFEQRWWRCGQRLTSCPRLFWTKVFVTHWTSHDTHAISDAALSGTCQRTRQKNETHPARPTSKQSRQTWDLRWLTGPAPYYMSSGCPQNKTQIRHPTPWRVKKNRKRNVHNCSNKYILGFCCQKPTLTMIWSTYLRTN